MVLNSKSDVPDNVIERFPIRKIMIEESVKAYIFLNLDDYAYKMHFKFCNFSTNVSTDT